jgi:hypothetical protein
MAGNHALVQAGNRFALLFAGILFRCGCTVRFPAKPALPEALLLVGTFLLQIFYCLKQALVCSAQPVFSLKIPGIYYSF